MQPANIQQTHIDISIARLSSYKAMFQGANDHELYGIYCWNEALSATLFRLISITEVVMRNRFHAALSIHVNGNSSVGRRDSNDWYNYLALPRKSAEKIRNETHRRGRNGQFIAKDPAPSANDVVSRMTFGFWPKLLDVDLPWGDLIPQIVPGHRYTNSAHWSVRRNQDAFYSRMDQVNKIRNRIAHFEPVWKQGALYEEKRFRQDSPNPAVVQNAPRTPAKVVQRLGLIHNRIAELLKWLSPDRYSDYKASYVESHFNWLCSTEGLAAYRQFQPSVNMPMARFKRELNGLCNSRSMVTVSHQNRRVGTFYPTIR